MPESAPGAIWDAQLSEGAEAVVPGMGIEQGKGDQSAEPGDCFKRQERNHGVEAFHGTLCSQEYTDSPP